jgi:hypothetical protein
MAKEAQISFGGFKIFMGWNFVILNNGIPETIPVGILFMDTLYEFLEEWRDGKFYDYGCYILTMKENGLEVYRKKNKSGTLIPKEECLRVFEETCKLLEIVILEQKCREVSSMKYGRPCRRCVEKYGSDNIRCTSHGIKHKLMEAYKSRALGVKGAQTVQFQDVEDLANDVAAKEIDDEHADD